jgi:hypothetical protein
MERITKYFTIVYSVLILLLALFYISAELYNSDIKNNVPEAKYDSQGNQLITQVPEDTPYFFLKQTIGLFTFFGFPIFIIFMSALYLYKQKEGYLKSLLLPVSFVLLVGIISFIWAVNFARGEEATLLFFIVPMLVITLIVSLIVNGIIFAIIKH